MVTIVNIKYLMDKIPQEKMEEEEQEDHRRH
jgi:hypothetical protein